MGLRGHLVINQCSDSIIEEGPLEESVSPSNYIEMLEIMATLPSFSACLNSTDRSQVVSALHPGGKNNFTSCEEILEIAARGKLYNEHTCLLQKVHISRRTSESDMNSEHYIEDL